MRSPQGRLIPPGRQHSASSGSSSTLRRHEVEYLVLDGTAANAHGAERITKDFDCFPSAAGAAPSPGLVRPGEAGGARRRDRAAAGYRGGRRTMSAAVALLAVAHLSVNLAQDSGQAAGQRPA